MNADGKGLFAAICADPEDDTSRLVYSDWLDEQGDAPRLALELELSRVRSDLASQSERIAPLEARSLELALELEKARGILEERERQVRRLERQAAISAQVFGRIRSGLETGVRVSEPEVREGTPTGSAALVPLEGEGQAAIILSRRTTIGRRKIMKPA